MSNASFILKTLLNQYNNKKYNLFHKNVPLIRVPVEFKFL